MGQPRADIGDFDGGFQTWLRGRKEELQEVDLLDILGLLLGDIGIEVLWQRLAHCGAGLPPDY